MSQNLFQFLLNNIFQEILDFRNNCYMDPVNDFTFDELKLAPHEENYEICKWFIPFSIKKRIKNRKASETANLILKVVNSW